MDCMNDEAWSCYKTNPLIQDIDVKTVIAHEGYDAEQKLHDIALLRLTKKAIITENVKTICIPMNFDEKVENLEEGKNMEVAGWGSVGKQSEKSFVKLKKENIQDI